MAAGSAGSAASTGRQPASCPRSAYRRTDRLAVGSSLDALVLVALDVLSHERSYGGIFRFEQLAQRYRALRVTWQMQDQLLRHLAERPADLLQLDRQMLVAEELQDVFLFVWH